MACFLGVREIKTAGEYTGGVTQQIASKLQYITVHTKPMPSSTELCVPRNSRLVNLLAAGLYGVHIAVSTQTTNGIGR